MKRFDALDVAFELAAALRPLLPALQKRDRDLVRQIKRAAISAASNLAEGSRRVGQDRAHLFRTAEGSAAEVHVQLLLATTIGYVSTEAAAEAIALADRLTAICYALNRVRAPKSA